LQYLGIAAASVLPIGFLIGTFSIFVLRAGFYLLSDHHYECAVKLDSLGEVSRRISSPFDEDKSKRNKREKKRAQLNIGVTFDHELLHELSPGLYDWLVRRWSAFNISVNSAMGALLGLLAGHFLLKIEYTPKWGWLSAVLCLAFSVNAVFAWSDTMKMSQFQRERLKIGTKQERNQSNESQIPTQETD